MTDRIDVATLEALFRAGGLGLAVVDTAKRYVRINEEFAAMNGVAASEHIGRTPREVIPQIAEAVESVLDHVLETKFPLIDVEVDPPGGGASVRVSLYPLLDEETAIGVLAVAMPPGASAEH